MTVTVSTIQTMGDFAQKLQDALNMAGYRYIGKIDTSKFDMDEWKNLSPKEMAQRYAQNENLPVKTHILEVIKSIYASNQRGVYNIGLRTLMTDHNLDYGHYIYPLMHCGMIKKQGELNGSTYKWLLQDKPLFSHAEAIFDLFTRMKSHKLTLEQEDFIEGHTHLGLKAIQDVMNPQSDPLMQYQVFRRYNILMQKQSKQNKKQQKLILTRELSRQQVNNPMQQTQLADDQLSGEGGQEQAGDIKESQKPKDSLAGTLNTDYPGELYVRLANKRIKMYKLIIEQQDKHLRMLEKELARKHNLKQLKSEMDQRAGE